MLQHAQMSHAMPKSTISAGQCYQVSKLHELDYAINVTVFGDILELDDDDEEYFTQSLVCDFFVLATRTLNEMEYCLASMDIKELWMKSQFLRGPCATLGVYKVESSCAGIEQLTAVANTFKTEGDSQSTLCNAAKILLEQARSHLLEAETALRRFYGID